MTYDLIELCAGTAAVALGALGAPTFPASRIGSKSGYTTPVLAALGMREGDARSVLLVEQDPRLARILTALFDTKQRERLAMAIEERAGADPRATWYAAKVGTTAADDLLWLAGARGGIGGFKGAHVRRANVDGFIPSRRSLARRVRAFAGFDGRATVLCADVCALVPSDYAATKVYIDAPYLNRQGYRYSLRLPVETIAAAWREYGHHVVASEGRALPGGTAHEITALRRGQKQRSLTTDTREWLTVYSRRAAR